VAQKSIFLKNRTNFSYKTKIFKKISRAKIGHPNAQPLNPSMYLSYLDIKTACSGLNKGGKCSKMLESTWPFYNSSRSEEDQLKMRIRQDAVYFTRQPEVKLFLDAFPAVG